MPLNNSKNKNNITFIVKKLMNSEYSVIGLLLLIILVASPITTNFLTINNFINVITRSSITALAAIGMTFVIISGHFDLSIGGIIVLVAYIGVETLLIQLGMNIYITVLIMMLIGALIGLINGFSVVAVGMPAFIATIAMMNITRGMAQFFYETRTVFNLPRAWRVFGLGNLFGIPMPIIIYLIFAIISHLLLKYTVFGRSVYAVGSNRRSAWLAGINTKRTIYIAFMISGITAAASSVIQTSRIFSVVGTLGTGIELDAISAVVIGGASLLGGEGTIFGAFIGAMIVETVSNILTLNRVSPFVVLIAKGLVLWFAIFIDMGRKGYIFKKGE